jgi:hypothetical protein
MPRTTPCQDAADALHCAFLLSLIAETEAKIAEELTRSDSDLMASIDYIEIASIVMDTWKLK